MKLLEFSFKNIFSYGNKLQTIEIKQNEPQLILLCGAKGQGKSSIKEAIGLSAYGKSPNRSLKQIPNRINGNAYLRTKFISNTGELVEIERGLAPNFLNLKINGNVPETLPDKKKIEDYIENALIQVPFKVFCNTIMVSVDDFKSFVSLSADDKRKIVDRIFGIGEVNDMSVLNKKELAAIQQRAEALEFSIRRNQDILNSSNEQLELLKKDVKVNNDAMVADLRAKLEDMKLKQVTASENLSELRPQLDDIQTEINQIIEKANKFKSGLSEIDKKIELYNKNKCPHCLSDLTDATHVTIKDKLLAKKKEVSEKLPSIIQEHAEKKQKHTDLYNKAKESEYTWRDLGNQISTINFQISSLESDDDRSDRETSRLSQLVNTIQEKVDEAQRERESLNDDIVIHSELARILSDDGMKRLLMARVIPMINQKIIERMAEIEFPYSFEFNENFDPIIHHLGKVIELESLSTGEKKEMNLITLFCILDLIIAKQNLNFLFLDEVFTSLDGDSIYRLVSMLRTFTNKHKITVFAISHDPLPAELFDKKLTIKKDKHFSDIYTG